MFRSKFISISNNYLRFDKILEKYQIKVNQYMCEIILKIFLKMKL